MLVSPPHLSERESFRSHVKQLRLATGLSVDQLQRRLEKGSPSYHGSLSRYLHEAGRRFPPQLVDALDAVFAELIPAYTPGSLRTLYQESEKRLLTPPPEDPAETPGHSPTTVAQADNPGETIASRGRRRAPLILLTSLAICALTACATWLWITQTRHVIAGSITCKSGQRVTGVFVKIEWLPDGVWGRTRPDPQDPNRTIYNADIPQLPYALHVGCGGTPQLWAVEARTPKTTATLANYQCDDLPGHLTTPPFLGVCLPD